MIAPMGMTPQVVRETHDYESTNPEPGSRMLFPFNLELENRPMIELVPFSSVPTGSANGGAIQVAAAIDLRAYGPIPCPFVACQAPGPMHRPMYLASTSCRYLSPTADRYRH